MKKIFFYFLICTGLVTYAQNPNINKVWAMGYGCCNHPLFRGINLDFSSGSLVVDTVLRHMNFLETNGQFYDGNNNLLFCSNGIYVANAADDTMQNGDGLNPCQFTTDHSTGTSSGLPLIQGNLVIPFPEDSTKYYLFHESIDDYGITNNILKLYYSVIDMTLDNGFGGVIQKNTVIINDTLVSGGLTACKHANGRDWWVVTEKGDFGWIYKLLISPTSIQVDTQNLQTVHSYNQGVFSQAGDKYAIYNPYTDLDIWDFDRCTGMFSNHLNCAFYDSASVPGIAFSPSGRFIYVSSSGVNSAYVYQFDLTAADVCASRQVVATRDSLADFYLMQLGPDGKIYIVGGQRYFHVINYPDSAGTACGFCHNCVSLPTYNGFTIPNHPNYFLGPEHGSPCDSLINDIPDISSSTFNIFPNPSSTILHVRKNDDEIINNVTVYSLLGKQELINYSFKKNTENIDVNISGLSNGIYFLEILTDERRIIKKFIKE